MSAPQRYGITLPVRRHPAARPARARARARRPRVHRPVVGGVGRLRRVHPARGRRAVGARAPARHRDRSRVHTRRAHARVDGRVDVPGRARTVRARHRHVVERDRRALERHDVRQAVPARARHDSFPARRAHGREGHRDLRDVRRQRIPPRHHRARAAADPRRRAARRECSGSRDAKATVRSSTGSRPTT